MNSMSSFNSGDLLMFPEEYELSNVLALLPSSPSFFDNWPIKCFADMESLKNTLAQYGVDAINIEQSISITKYSSMYICSAQYKSIAHLCIFFVGCTTDINTNRGYNNIIKGIIHLNRRDITEFILNKLC